MPDPNSNIFLTTENLAFSLPLIAVCATYAYFKYVPLNVALPILGGVFLLYLIRSQFQKQRAKKLTNLDENVIQDLIGEEEENNIENDKKAASLQKAKNKVQARLAQERKAASKQSNKSKKKGGAEQAADDDDDDALLQSFAKGSRGAATKKKK